MGTTIGFFACIISRALVVVGELEAVVPVQIDSFIVRIFTRLFPWIDVPVLPYVMKPTVPIKSLADIRYPIVVDSRNKEESILLEESDVEDVFMDIAVKHTQHSVHRH